MKRNDKLLDQIRGGLFGVAIGDALGGTTEFRSRAEIRAKHGYLTEIIGGGVWGLKPGEVTDDTMMTLCVAEGVLDDPAEPMVSIGTRFMDWYMTRPKDIGNIIRHVFELYEGNWFEAAFLADLDLGRSGGNGSLMRCLPVALAFPDWPTVERVTRMQSKMTHYDESCSEACVLYNRTAYLLLQGGVTLRQAIEQSVTGTEYATSLSDAPPACEPDGYVVHTLHWVLHHLWTGTSYGDIVQRAANQGGDSDTNAAIAGGPAGLYWGYEQLPRRYVDTLLIRDRLRDVSERLYRLRVGRESL
ncbi:ADP-ribosylglycohydrolase family protein [Paenibacillus koleovorans]|uniref:ADP-ribosylglycohydrolase family protein n=1 Tax=Paenibacillus koleovorans TaxID=121608 RepID=UPI001FE93688|nr:ADP-ribosylglycohydrolase family protein [Paenibacillus koleovorans]